MQKSNQTTAEEISRQPSDQKESPTQEVRPFKMVWKGKPIDFWTEEDGFLMNNGIPAKK